MAQVQDGQTHADGDQQTADSSARQAHPKRRGQLQYLLGCIEGRVSYSIHSGCERVKGGRGGSVTVSTRGVRGLRGAGEGQLQYPLGV